MNALEEFHAAMVNLQCRTGRAIRHVKQFPAWSEDEKTFHIKQLECAYVGEEMLLRAYYEVWE